MAQTESEFTVARHRRRLSGHSHLPAQRRPIDDQALHILLRSKVAYIGALGSKKTHAKRVARLSEAGFTETEIAKIHGPVGVSINARRPKEIALSIVAELVMVKNRFL